MAKILVVDDNHAVAETVSLVLSEAGYATTIAHSLDRAEDLIESAQFDAAVVDVWLGDHDGLDLATFLADRTPPMPFIIMSGGGPGRSLETVTARADILGAGRVLYKPFDDDELLTAVSAILPD